MKHAGMKLILIVMLSLSLSGCALLYNDVKTPLPSLSVNADTQNRTSTGKASCASYVWLVALGDCSVETAMKNGNITKVHHVDSEFTSYFFGIYTKFTTVVYGE
ncbi:MAG TPA: TRL-like family protein [Deltaproteobacteria bacterium]|nr:TRL-like family protein [Deltaproteobacteria bacterium]HPR55021.1 TRL-like family protein [Deltaproteobacteria bacterium]HXK46358.1 TRL-like family protein [Deltaproteobacteria bacterium]